MVSQYLSASHPRCYAFRGSQRPPLSVLLTTWGESCPSILPPVLQRGSQHLGLHAGLTGTTSGAILSGLHVPSGGTILKIVPGASPPLTKFPNSSPPISVWHCQTPQHSLSAVPPPHVSNPMGMCPPLPPSLRSPGLAQTLISTVLEMMHLRPPGTQYKKWQV